MRIVAVCIPHNSRNHLLNIAERLRHQTFTGEELLASHIERDESRRLERLHLRSGIKPRMQDVEPPQRPEVNVDFKNLSVIVEEVSVLPDLAALERLELPMLILVEDDFRNLPLHEILAHGKTLLQNPRPFLCLGNTHGPDSHPRTLNVVVEYLQVPVRKRHRLRQMLNQIDPVKFRFVSFVHHSTLLYTFSSAVKRPLSENSMGMKSLFALILLLSVLALTNCGGTKTEPNAGNSGNTAQSTAVDPLGSVPAGGRDATVNQAETVAPVLKAFCDAMTKKDDAALRAVYSAASVQSLEARMRKEKYKSMVEMFEMDQISNKVCEIRNEKITGDSAIAELKTEGTPNGVKVKLVKEGGVWKLTNESPELDAVKGSK